MPISNPTRSRPAPLRTAAVVAVLCLVMVGALCAEPAFIRNRGQWNEAALYRLRLPGGQVWFTRNGVVYDLWDSAGGHVVRQELGGAAARVEGGGEAAGRWNFITGSSSVANVEAVREVWYRNVRPGLSLRYYVAEGRLKYDLIVAPGANPAQLRMRWLGARGVRSEDGEIVVETDVAELRESPPIAWQDGSGNERIDVECRYRFERGVVEYRTGVYDRTKPLVIDPAITLGTYVGGDRAESGRGVSADSIGNIYTVGLTRSEDFPTTLGAYRQTITSFTGASDLFVAKYDPTGTVLLFGTYIGGRGSEDPAAIRVISRLGANGVRLPAIILVAGTTYSIDFPTTPGVHMRTPQGGADGFLLGLAPDGRSLVFSTLLGGESDDVVTGLEVGNFENPYVCGWTRSATLPASASFISGVGGGDDAFVARYSALADTLKWMVRYGGTGDDHAEGVTVEPGGAAWTTGWTESAKVPTTDSAVATSSAGSIDAFVLRVRFNGAALDYATMFGGSGDDLPAAIAVDAAKGVVITGRTTSFDFPIVPAGLSTIAGSWFASRFAFLPSSRPVYSRMLGVADGGGGEAVAIESSGDAVLAGTTTSLFFPVTPDATLVTPRGARDLAVIRLSANGGTVRHSAVLGGGGEDSLARSIVVQRPGSVVLGGTTFSTNLPLPRPTHDSLLNVRGSNAFSDAFLLRYAIDRRASIHAVTRRAFAPVRCDSVALDTFTVRNLGDAELAIVSHRFSGAGTPFTIVSPTIATQPLRVAPGDSIRYIVRVRFTTVDLVRDTLEISSNDSTPGKRPLRIAYEALRAPVVLLAQPSTLSFATTLACTTESNERTVQLRNVGTGALTVTSISLLHNEPSFTIGSQPGVPLFLGEGVQASVRMLFHPSGRGLHRDTLVVQVAECSRAILVPLQGNGDTAALVLPIRSINLGSIGRCRIPLDTTLALFNTGGVPVNLNVASSDAALLLRSPSFPDTLRPGSSLDFGLTIRPSAPGPFRAVLRISGEPCGLVDSIVVTGTLQEGPQVDAPARLALDTVPGCGGLPLVFDTSVVLVNRGAEALLLDTLLLPPLLDGSVLPVLPATLLPGDSIRFPVRVRSAGGAFDTEVRFTAESNGCIDTVGVRVDGVLIAALPSVAPAAISFPLLQQCEFAYDTVIVVRNPLPVGLTVESVGSGGDILPLDPLPLVLAPHGAAVLRVRFVPQQSGSTFDTLLLITAGCGDTVRIPFEGEKRGSVVRATPEKVHLSPLVCEGDAGRTATLLLHNGGDGPSATVRSATFDAPGFILLGDPSGTVIPQSGEIAIVLRYTGNAFDTVDRATLLLVFDPCGDTLRVPLDARLDSIPRAALHIDLGNLRLGDNIQIDTALLNPVRATLTVEGSSSSASSLVIDSLSPPSPLQLGEGESVRVALRVRPVVEGRFSDTAWIVFSAPCRDSMAVVLEGRVLGTSGDTLRLCIDDAAAGGAGDTVTLRIEAEGVALNGDTARVDISYDASRLLLLSARTAVGDPVAVHDRRGTATLSLPPGIVTGGMPLRLDFRLLAGRGGVAHLRVDSVVGSGLVAAVCDREATVIVADRCLVTGVAFGRYASLLEPVRPSPARDRIEVTWQQLEDATTTIRLVDAAGRESLRSLDSPLPGGRYTVQVPLGDLPPGWYLLVVEAGEWRGVRPVLVAR